MGGVNALEQKQKCISMASQDKRENNMKRESGVEYVLDYENETKRACNTMVETTSKLRNVVALAQLVKRRVLQMLLKVKEG